jgi:hypothetical protein
MLGTVEESVFDHVSLRAFVIVYILLKYNK